MGQKKFKILDLFSGAGGFSCGLHMVNGFSTEVATDFDSKVLNTFQKNFPQTKCICGDISQSDIKEQIIHEATDRKVNLIIGGPPCQGFSLKGKNLGIKDPRNFLFLEYVDIVKRIIPEIFIIENVKNIIAAEHGFFINQIYEEFQNIGYHLKHTILNSSDFGVPQTRERAIIIGTLGENKIQLPTKKDILPPTTVRDAISDLAYLESGEGIFEANYKNSPNSEYQKFIRKNSNKLYNHIATNHSKFALEKLSMIPAEGNKSSMPFELYGKQKFKTTWSRLIWDKPSPTIDTRFDTPSNGRNSHPYLNRSITPREAARIQSFPDTYIFYGNKCSICKQIGNAVPPLLAKAIGESLKEALYDK